MFRLIAFAALCLLPATAHAQSASHINTVLHGQSCPGCNLFQADLSYRDIPGVDLSGSRLRQANLSLTTMNNADFAAANLSVSNLFGARFTSANFHDADFTHASMVGAYFGFADVTGANFTGANLSGAEFDTARGLTQAQLNAACGDEYTRLPHGLSVPLCRATPASLRGR